MIERFTGNAFETVLDERILPHEDAIRIAEKVSQTTDMLIFRATPSLKALEFIDIMAGPGRKSRLSGDVSFDPEANQITGTMTIERPNAPGVQPCHITNHNAMRMWQIGPDLRPRDDDDMAAFLALNVTPDLERAYCHVQQPDMKPRVLFQSICDYLPARAHYAQERVTYSQDYPLIEPTGVYDATVELERRRRVDETSPIAQAEDAVMLRTRRTLDDGFAYDAVYSLRIGHGFTSLALFGLSDDNIMVDLSGIPTEHAMTQLYEALEVLIHEKLAH